MRLGFVGVGRWAQKLRSAFEAEGATAAAFWRGKSEGPGIVTFEEAAGWGEQWSPQVMIDNKNIDALVLCAPPDVTTEVALACAAAGKPVMATKPLMLTEAAPISAPFYVDFWRLWDEPYQFLWRQVSDRAKSVKRAYCMFYGSGPHRSFPGLLDYGPHAVAFARNLFRVKEFDAIRLNERKESNGGEVLTFSLRLTKDDNPFEFMIETGNGAKDGVRGFLVEFKQDYKVGWVESPTDTAYREGSVVISSQPKELALRRMCRSFMNDISEGFVTTEHLDLSCAVMRDLAEVRRLAEEKKA